MVLLNLEIGILIRATKWQSLFCIESYNLYYYVPVSREYMYWRKSGRGLPYLEKRGGKVLEKTMRRWR